MCGNISHAFACTSTQIDTGSTCVDTKFTITTKNLSANTSVSFYLTATGTFYVDCGDGTLSGTGASGKTITRTSTSDSATYSCAYTSGGTKTIRMAGRATGYHSTNPTISFYAANEETAAIDGSLGAIFPTLGQNSGQQPVFYRLFHSNTHLTSIPGNLFSGVTGATDSMFKEAFYGCTGLTSIPENLFGGVSGAASNMFDGTFYGCTGLTSIPEKLFRGVSGSASSMFYRTFDGCTGLTSIPGKLFRGVSGGANSMFGRTFRGCTGITSIPGNLFSGVTNAAENLFTSTFANCTNLTGYIPSSTFSGLVANHSPTATAMWSSTFAGTNLDTSCPAKTTPYTTGYETAWADSTANGMTGEGRREIVACNPPVILAMASYVIGMYNDVDNSKQNKLTSSGANPNVILTGDSNGIVSSFTANNGVITVTRSNITLPVGSQTSTKRANIWTEQ